MSTSQDGRPDDEAVAVVGIAGRFPGAADLDAFWADICAGREGLVDLSDEELLAGGVPRSVLDHPGYVRRAGVLDGYQEFDAAFFGLPPATAAAMDPQQRLFLECCWHALEDAGHDPARRDGSVGVFGAPSFSGYFGYNLLSRHRPQEFLGAGTSPALIHALTLTDPNFFATRVAHALDLRGPALTVQTACSGSLVAVHLACQSLLCGESDVALAGGMTVKVPHRTGYLYEPDSMMSADGRCRPFDAAAGGTVFGSGGGVVVLKRLTDALADGDRIRAVVRGTAVNNDGSLKMGFTAPSVKMQAAVVAEALSVAGVDPHAVGHVEAHGTGTALGDPMEMAALRQALDPHGNRTSPCLIGSVKGNIGHLEAASGVVGLIKTVLALESATVPGTAHFTAPNPELGLAGTPFEVAVRTRPWPAPGPRIAGVSSLGVGGTNAHVIVEQAPPAPARSAPADGTGAVPVLTLSARTAEALRDARLQLADALDGRQGRTPGLGDVAYTLTEGRARFAYRAAVAARTPDHAARLLREDRTVLPVPRRPLSPVLVFPGQGAQYPGMGADLYRDDEVFRSELDRCAWLFAAEPAGSDIRDVLFGSDEAELRRTDRAQPALFAVEYALARTLERYGVRPDAVGGHSIGEYAAACLAGVVELADAVRLVATRGRLMHSAPPGTMLAVPLNEERTREHLVGSGLELAAVNSPEACVVAGPHNAAGRLARRLEESGVRVTAVRTAHAFHSAAMDEAAERFADVARTVAFHVPSLPLVSNVSGTWLSDAEAVDPLYWARQLRATVRWADCVRTLLTGEGRMVAEAGPGRVLGPTLRGSDRWSRQHRAVSMLPHARESAAAAETWGRALGLLWESGVDVDWTPARHGAEGPVPLPGYPFRRVRHWTEAAWTRDDFTDEADTPGAAAPPVQDEADTPGAAVPPVQDEADTPGAAAPPVQDDPAATPDAVRILTGILTAVLGVPHVGPDDGFFDLGGDSVLANQVAAQARTHGLILRPKDVFEHPTARRLAHHIN
ncbi:type I polyketide synthase [Streptomyces sp. NBC_01242]|uniref:type I polyketide synthase n=1 Tax=Streptomyces sp. NBC_01242 TaxID=2903795 RepID=UPI002259149D|nr:type I polyketide synthase [Streptomyces sp. NBC_01242]MCX4793330.1 type I polyketide synthase [Streptomyces sp. NBC_01242]